LKDAKISVVKNLLLRNVNLSIRPRLI